MTTALPPHVAARLVAIGNSLATNSQTLEQRSEQRDEKKSSMTAAREELRQFTAGRTATKPLTPVESEELLHITQRMQRTETEYDHADRERRRSLHLCNDLEAGLVQFAISVAKEIQESGPTTALDLPADHGNLPIADIVGNKLGKVLEAVSIFNLQSAMKGMGKSGRIVEAFGDETISAEDATAISEALFAYAEAAGMDTTGMMQIDASGVSSPRKKKKQRTPAIDPDQMEMDSMAALKGDARATEQPEPKTVSLPQADAGPAGDGDAEDNWEDSESIIAAQIRAGRLPTERTTLDGKDADIVMLPLVDHGNLSFVEYDELLDYIGNLRRRAIAVVDDGFEIDAEDEEFLRSGNGEDVAACDAVVHLAAAYTAFPSWDLGSGESESDNGEDRIPAWLSREVLAAACGFAQHADRKNETWVFRVLQSIVETAASKGAGPGTEMLCKDEKQRKAILACYPELQYLDEIPVESKPTPKKQPKKKSKKKKTSKKTVAADAASDE